MLVTFLVVTIPGTPDGHAGPVHTAVVDADMAPGIEGAVFVPRHVVVPAARNVVLTSGALRSPPPLMSKPPPIPPTDAAATAYAPACESKSTESAFGQVAFCAAQNDTSAMVKLAPAPKSPDTRPILAEMSASTCSTSEMVTHPLVLLTTSGSKERSISGLVCVSEMIGWLGREHYAVFSKCALTSSLSLSVSASNAMPKPTCEPSRIES